MCFYFALRQVLNAYLKSFAAFFRIARQGSLCFCYCLSTKVSISGQGRNEGEQGGRNSPGAESLWGTKSLRGEPNGCGGRKKIPTMSQALYSIQYICFRKTSVSNMGVPNLLLSRARSNLQPRYAPVSGSVIFLTHSHIPPRVIMPGYYH